MYYYVDGYNLALRSRRFEGGNFQDARQAWICWLSEHSTELGLHMTLVFDSNYAPGISQRGHLAALEVVYTAQGETADEWILAALANKRRSKQIVVVTSDKLLAKHARHLGAKTEPIEAFLKWLDKRIEKKTPQIPFKGSLNTTLSPTHKPAIPPTAAAQVLLKRRASVPLPLSDAPAAVEKPFDVDSASGFSYYLAAFETRWHAQNSAEELRRAAKKSAEQLKKNKSSPHKQKPSHQQMPPCNSPQIESDMSRWQRLFEQNYNLNDPEGSSR